MDYDFDVAQCLGSDYSDVATVIYNCLTYDHERRLAGEPVDAAALLSAMVSVAQKFHARRLEMYAEDERALNLTR